jgi:hypothetical protein
MSGWYVFVYSSSKEGQNKLCEEKNHVKGAIPIISTKPAHVSVKKMKKLEISQNKPKTPYLTNSLSIAISSFVTNFPAVGTTTRSPPAEHASFEFCCKLVTMPVLGSTKQVTFDAAATTP